MPLISTHCCLSYAKVRPHRGKCQKDQIQPRFGGFPGKLKNPSNSTRGSTIGFPGFCRYLAAFLLQGCHLLFRSCGASSPGCTSRSHLWAIPTSPPLMLLGGTHAGWLFLVLSGHLQQFWQKRGPQVETQGVGSGFGYSTGVHPHCCFTGFIPGWGFPWLMETGCGGLLTDV